MSEVLPTTTISKFMKLAALLEQASYLVREIGREQTGLSKSKVEDQAWFWTDEWQAAEREVDAALKLGDYKDFDNLEEMLTDLHASL